VPSVYICFRPPHLAPSERARQLSPASARAKGGRNLAGAWNPMMGSRMRTWTSLWTRGRRGTKCLNSPDTEWDDESGRLSRYLLWKFTYAPCEQGHLIFYMPLYSAPVIEAKGTWSWNYMYHDNWFMYWWDLISFVKHKFPWWFSSHRWYCRWSSTMRLDNLRSWPHLWVLNSSNLNVGIDLWFVTIWKLNSWPCSTPWVGYDSVGCREFLAMSRCLMGGTDNAKPHRHVVIRRLVDFSVTIHSSSSCLLYWNFLSRRCQECWLITQEVRWSCNSRHANTSEVPNGQSDCKASLRWFKKWSLIFWGSTKCVIVWLWP